MNMAKIIEKVTTVPREIILSPAKPGDNQQERVLTVQSGRKKGTSQLTLSGVWLADARFNPNDKVLISVNESRLVIEKLEENHTTAGS